MNSRGAIKRIIDASVLVTLSYVFMLAGFTPVQSVLVPLGLSLLSAIGTVINRKEHFEQMNKITTLLERMGVDG